MKKNLLALLFVLAIAAPLRAISAAEFWGDFKNDTKAVLGKEFKVSVHWDFLEHDARVSGYSSVLAYKFLALGPAVSFTPNDSTSIAEAELQLPLNLKRLPLGNGIELGDKIKSLPVIGGWFDRIFVEPYLSHNLSTGKLGLGATLGVKFG